MQVSDPECFTLALCSIELWKGDRLCCGPRLEHLDAIDQSKDVEYGSIYGGSVQNSKNRTCTATTRVDLRLKHQKVKS